MAVSSTQSGKKQKFKDADFSTGLHITHAPSVPIIPLHILKFIIVHPCSSHPIPAGPSPAYPTCHPLADFQSPCGVHSKSWAAPRSSWAAAVAGHPARDPGPRNSPGDRPASRPWNHMGETKMVCVYIYIGFIYIYMEKVSFFWEAIWGSCGSSSGDFASWGFVGSLGRIR